MPGRSLEQRLARYGAGNGGRGRDAFAGVHQRGLRARIERRLDDAVARFELDRLLYDLEVDAQAQWLDRLVEFDAYCAERGRQAGA